METRPSGKTVYITTGNYPAWTAIGGIVLLSPGQVVEMRVIGSGNAEVKIQQSAPSQ